MIDRDLHTGTLLLQQHRYSGITLAPATVKRLGQLIKGEVRHRHRHFHLATKSGGERYVLVREAQSEVWRVVDSRQEMGGQSIEGSRPPECALTDRFP